MTAILAFLFTELHFQKAMAEYYADVQDFPAAGRSLVKMYRIRVMIADTFDTIADLEVLGRMKH